jgi:hypothetical protein
LGRGAGQAEFGPAAPSLDRVGAGGGNSWTRAGSTRNTGLRGANAGDGGRTAFVTDSYSRILTRSLRSSRKVKCRAAAHLPVRV